MEGENRKGEPAAWTTKGPESTANMTPQGLIFLVGWDKMSIHYGINLYPNPLSPILPTLLLHPSILYSIQPPPTLPLEPVVVLIASIETIG